MVDLSAVGVRKFVSLDDTPASFSGQAGKYTKVDPLEKALDFAAVEAGIAEGDYTSWTHKWTNDIPDGLRPDWYCGFHIDERSNVITLIWQDSALDRRFGVYNLEDFSVVFESNAGEFYAYTILEDAYDIELGCVNINYGGATRSIQSYILIARTDGHTMEVWRGGAAPIWSHSIQDEIAGVTFGLGEISLTGKWILMMPDATSKLILYEGT